MRHSNDLDLIGKCCLKLIAPRRMKTHFHLPFQSTFALFFPFIFRFVEKRAYYESRRPKLNSRNISSPLRKQVSASYIFTTRARSPLPVPASPSPRAGAPRRRGGGRPGARTPGAGVGGGGGGGREGSACAAVYPGRGGEWRARAHARSCVCVWGGGWGGGELWVWAGGSEGRSARRAPLWLRVRERRSPALGPARDGVSRGRSLPRLALAGRSSGAAA